ncbi:MAG: hypothetical protein A2Z78_01360 [Candidatus Nealsonbacteria bacterium RBG_13_36_15]|uniref:Type II secretion system protein GspH n=1 Tax=Candidatus Nealsonbacteria bacterium RBG_13_36_15 TaxID=1801660 RepID=A0A1G2DX31_9BACT|nr:MAG: hypothetical protein A2Z78_01360 [Candidatus Nealsonbacteria bacterium RBG_13_36_15]
MKKNKGFTLLEVTVVIMIISLLSTIFIASYREGEKQFALKRSTHQLAQSLRKAQGMALSSQELMGLYQGGYGIYFSITPGDKYTLFIDCNNDNKFDDFSSDCQDCRSGPDSCIPYFSEKIEEFTLEKGITISDLVPSSAEDDLCITFIPPDPTVVFPGAGLASITLNFEGGSGKTVFVNKVGLIEIE